MTAKLVPIIARTFDLPPDVVQWLEDEARRQQIRQKAIVIAALEEARKK